MSKFVDVHLHTGNVGEHISPCMFHELRKPFLNRALGPDEPEGDVEEARRDRTLIDDMDVGGIDIGIVMAGDFRRSHPEEDMSYYVPNDFVAELVEEYPDRLVGCGSVDPIRDPGQAAKEVDRCVNELGMKSIKLYPTYNHFSPDDPTVYPIYEKAVEHDIPVQLHMGWTPVKTASMDYQAPELLDEVGRQFPDLKLVIAHMGYPYWETTITLLGKHENFYTELSGWGWFGQRKILRMLHVFGSICPYEKLMYGSENPFLRDFPDQMRSIREAAEEHGYEPISEDDLEGIMGKNAARLYDINTEEFSEANRPKGSEDQ